MAFPRLQELAAAQNSNSLTDAMSVYIERKINEDLHFAAGLSHLWEVLYSRVDEHRLLIAELNVFGGPLALQLSSGDKEVTMQYLELKGGDRGACKLLGDVIEVLGCLLEVLGCLKWVKMKEKGCRVHFISG
ncbi:hypothetical protein Tco_0499713 [Tanacetum coccineum]